MQNYFNTLSDKLFSLLKTEEKLLINFEGENSNFVRFNHNKIRQAGHVTLRRLTLDLILNARHASATADISGSLQQDISLLTYTLKNLREQCAFLPDDPYLFYAEEIHDSENHKETDEINSLEAVEQIHTAANKMDMVGIFANGSQCSGFSNSLGQRNWHNTAHFNLDWSSYHNKDKAVKGAYAGFNWQADILTQKMQAVEEQLTLMSKAPMTIKPGNYRAYIAPAALNEIISMLAWGGFSLKSQRTKETPLIQMLEDDLMLSPGLCIKENNARALAPLFTRSGFIKPDQVELIENGMIKDTLVDPRSAKEYDSTINAESEYPGALEIASGNLSQKNILKVLDTGIYINNLWYLNFSDRNACKLTGMTRFACFWVENGEIKAPINVMRFDESLYDLLGDNLQHVTKEREFIFDPGTYGKRSNSSIELPGILVKSICLTL